MSNQQADYKKNLKSSFKYNIWGHGIADMQLTSKFNKSIVFYHVS